MTGLDQPLPFRPCARCEHPNHWHRHDDTAGDGQDGHGNHSTSVLDDPYDGCPFRCVGYDVWEPGPPPADPCTCPDYVAPSA